MSELKINRDSEPWWEHVEVAPIGDLYTARQVITFHERREVPCAHCSRGLVCPRLTEARAIVARDGSTTDAGAGPISAPTVPSDPPA